MFQFRRFPAYAYLIQRTLTEYCSAGLPHSEIHGLMDICSSPWLIAACRVLRRLLMPRHSPCALSSLTNQKLTIPRSFSFVNYAGSSDLEIVSLPCILSDAVPQLFLVCHAFQHDNLSVALLHLHVTLFSFQGAGFQPLLQSDLKIQPLQVRSSNPAANLLGGPEWARTTDLTIISRTL